MIDTLNDVLCVGLCTLVILYYNLFNIFKNEPQYGILYVGEKSYAQHPSDIKHDDLNKKLIPHNINYLND